MLGLRSDFNFFVQTETTAAFSIKHELCPLLADLFLHTQKKESIHECLKIRPNTGTLVTDLTKPSLSETTNQRRSRQLHPQTTNMITHWMKQWEKPICDNSHITAHILHSVHSRTADLWFEKFKSDTTQTDQNQLIRYLSCWFCV